MENRSGGERDTDVYFEPATNPFPAKLSWPNGPTTLENGGLGNRAYQGARRTNVSSQMRQKLAARAGHEEALKAIQINWDEHIARLFSRGKNGGLSA